MNTDTSKMAVPMVAITHCHLGTAVHAPETTFDALTPENGQFFHDRASASFVTTGDGTGTALPPITDDAKDERVAPATSVRHTRGRSR